MSGGESLRILCPVPLEAKQRCSKDPVFQHKHPWILLSQRSTNFLAPVTKNCFDYRHIPVLHTNLSVFVELASTECIFLLMGKI
jgi:hypothetical protein